MSLSLFVALLAGLCQALDVSVTREPLLLGSHDTGCILERTKVQHTCSDVTPQLMTFRIDCREAPEDFQEFSLDGQRLCAHVIKRPSHEVNDFVLRRGDFAEFRCILWPLDSASHQAVFPGTIRAAFLESSGNTAENITAFELVLPGECTAAVAKVYEWLLAVQSQQNKHRILWQSPKLQTSPFKDMGTGAQRSLQWKDQDFLNPTVAFVGCDKVSGNLREAVHIIQVGSNFDSGEADVAWYGIQFEIDVDMTALPADTLYLQLVLNFSSRDPAIGHDFVREQRVSVPVKVVHSDTKLERLKRSFWFRFVIFLLLACLVVAVALRFACGSCDGRPRLPQPPQEIELHRAL
eukprot:Skav217663  [mRNA]  locus=scaffold2919:152501:153893:+ [translate_table: standard]